MLWRVTFALTSLVGLATTVRLIRLEASAVRGPFRRNRWAVALAYGLVLVLGVLPGLARALGLAPIRGAAILLVLLVVLTHGLTWEFMMEPDEAAAATQAPAQETP